MAAKPSGYFETLTSDGSTAWKTVVGPVSFSFLGTFGSGTAILQRKDDAGAAVTVAGSSQTAAYDGVADFPPGAVNIVRVNLSGSTSPDLDTHIWWTDNRNPNARPDV